MSVLCAALPLLLLGAPSEALLRDIVVRTALMQAERPDPHWDLAQRDCAGLVRFSYREAYRLLADQRLATGLWRTRDGKTGAFADAETLLAYSFTSLGRDAQAMMQVKAGDLVAFRQESANDEPAVYHLFMAVRASDKANHAMQVVYHPGRANASVQVGRFDELMNEAPKEWQPTPENPAFLGYFRFNEWMTDD